MSGKTTWEEIKALAADFQRTQLTGTLQKLSDRNCVEVVKKLIELNLIELIFTLDGKEYITPQHLVKEINDELIVNGGRIHLTELVSILNVDYSHVEAKASEVVKDSYGDVSLVLGQLVNTEYKDNLAKEINGRLQQHGTVTIAELTKLYDLPADFLQELVASRLNTYIDGVQDQEDPKTYFTHAYLDKYRSKIVGVLTGVTKPVPVKQIISRYNFPEKIFNNVVQSLIKSGRIAGSIVGSGGSKSYIPNVYAKAQNEWVENFYKQNGYLEYDALNRIGIADPRAYLKKKDFGDLTYLTSCCVGKAITFQVESDVEECINSESWVDFVTMLPSVLNDEDIQQLVQNCLDANKHFKDSCVVLSDTVIVSSKLLESSFGVFDAVMKTKAEEHLKEGILFEYFAAAQVLKDKEFESELSRKDRRKKKQGKDKVADVQEEEDFRSKGNKKKGRQSGKAEPAKVESESNPREEKKESLAETKQTAKEPQTAKESKHEPSPGGSPAKDKKNSADTASTLSGVPDEKDTKATAKSSKPEKPIPKEAAATQKEEKKKKPTGKDRSGAGGGTQGREIKVKAVKKKYKPTSKADQDDSDIEVAKEKVAELRFMTVEEITDFLQKNCSVLEDCPTEVVDDLAKRLHGSLNEKYIQIAKSVFSSSIQPRGKEIDVHDAEKGVNKESGPSPAEGIIDDGC